MAKRIFITGGSSGIGLALAKYYAQAGDDLLLLARDSAKLQSAVDTLAPVCSEGQIVAGESVDTTAFDRLSARMEELINCYGVPDILILSAGIGVCATFLNTDKYSFERVMDVNLIGNIEMVRAILPGMIERGSGQIALISSLAGMIGPYGYSAYAASKFALNGFAQVLRQELYGTGIKINLVCPPEVDTPLVAEEAHSILPQTRFSKDLVGTLSPELTARQIASGLKRNKALVVPGFRAKLASKTAQHFPRMFEKTSQLLVKWVVGQ